MCRFVADSVRLSSFYIAPENTPETECVLAVHCHPRSLILVRIESSYATSY